MNQRIPPHPPRRFLNKTRITNQRQRSDQSTVGADRQRKNVNLRARSGIDEFMATRIAAASPRKLLGAIQNSEIQPGARPQRISKRIENSNSQNVIAIPKPLDSPVQRSRRFRRNLPLEIILQTLAQHFRAPLQIAAHGAV